MILNAFAVLALLFVAVLVVAGCLLAMTVVRARRRAVDPLGPSESHDGGDPVRPLTLQLVGLITALALVSVALWGLVLESYVPQWDGLRCAVGVLRVGTGSEGAPGLLPGLAGATSFLLPATLFAAGLGVVLHALGRDRPEERLRPLHRGVLLLVALLAMTTGCAEAAWLLIPKAEQFLAAGCCTTVGAAELPTLAAARSDAAPWALATLFAVPVLVLAGLLAGWPSTKAPRLADALRLAAAAAVLYAGLVFAQDVVAPSTLGLPLHRCRLCLAADAPEAALGLGLLWLPVLTMGWRAGGRLLGGRPGPAFTRLAGRLDRAGFVGAVGGLLLLFTMWWVA